MYLRKGVTVPTLNIPRPVTTEASVASLVEEQAGPSTSSMEATVTSSIEEQSGPATSSSSTAFEPLTPNIQNVSPSLGASDLLLQDVGVTRQTELTPKAHRLYKKAVILRRSVKQ
jgi:hypothetical protein